MSKKDIIKFEEFSLNEADHYDNDGLPIEYLRMVRDKNVSEAERNIGAPQIILPLAKELHDMSRGHEEELEKIAIDTIKDLYGDILENVEIDAKIVRPDRVKQEMAEAIEENENPEEDEDFDYFKHDDEDETPEEPEPEQEPEEEREEVINFDDYENDSVEIKGEVDKRKILNTITQGESKNIHRIVHMEEVKEKLDAINPRFVPTMDNLLKLNEFTEWLLRKETALPYLREQPNGLNSVAWDNEPETKDDSDSDNTGGDETEPERTAQDILDDITNPEDLLKHEEELSEMFEDGNPKIIVRAVDFPILLHEITKGIFELIISVAIPEDANTAEKVLAQTDSFSDEFDDLRYGIDMKRDYTDYVIKRIDDISKEKRSAETHNNLKEYVFGALLDPKNVSTKNFLMVTHTIFSSYVEGLSVDIEKQRKTDKIIDDAINYIVDKLDAERAEWDKYYADLEEHEKDQKEMIDKGEDSKVDTFAEVQELEKELSEIDDLKQKMKVAIEDEDYEAASEYRDKIEALK